MESMGQKTVLVDSSSPVQIAMKFQGIARYSAATYEPVEGADDKWKQVRVLEDDGDSTDARPDVFQFDPPARGKQLLFFFDARLTAAVVPADVSATAVVAQGRAPIDEVKETGHVETTFTELVVRVLLEGK